MISKIYVGSPIQDHSFEGGATPIRFYLISFFNKPYRVIYTRYPYSYLKRLVYRFARGKVKKTSLLCFRDVTDTICPSMPRWIYSSLVNIRPIYIEFVKFDNDEETKPLTKSRIREIIDILEGYYRIKPLSLS